MATVQQSKIVSFGPYRVDLRSGELYKGGVRIRARHGGECHPELRRQLTLRRQPFPGFETAGLDFAGNSVGNLAVDRLTSFVALREGNCHPCNMSFDDDCSQT